MIKIDFRFGDEIDRRKKMDWMSKNVTVIKIESIIGSFGLKIVQFKPDTLEKVLSEKLVRYNCFFGVL